MKPRIFCALLAAALLCGCSRSDSAQYVPKQPSDPSNAPESSLPVNSEGPLLYLAETREAADEIASLYGIELVSYEDGLAVYYTDEDPRNVILRGEENGWPQLSPNYIVTPY